MSAESTDGATHRILLLDPVGAPAVSAALGERLAAAGVTVLDVRPVTEPDGGYTEIAVRAPHPHDQALPALTRQLAPENSAVLPVAGTARLLVFDVDSTLIIGEVVEMLADRAGHRTEVERITAAAMRGELDFAASLRERVALLAGLDAGVLDEVGSTLELVPGAQRVVETSRARGWRCGIVSGGFTQVVSYLVDRLGLNFAAANTLDVVGGRLTGKLAGPIVDRAGKAAALRRFADREGVPMWQTVAVGDGANDLDMIDAAGLGVAFNAKPVVAARADVDLRGPSLLPVRYLVRALTAPVAP